MTCEIPYLVDVLARLGFFVVLGVILIGPVFLIQWLKRRFP
jgi:hypothetical protein